MRTMSDRVHIIAIVKCALNRLAQRIGKKQGGLRLSYSRRVVVVILFGILKTPFFYDHSSSLATVVFVGSILRFLIRNTRIDLFPDVVKSNPGEWREGEGFAKNNLVNVLTAIFTFSISNSVEGTRRSKSLK